MSDEAFVNRVLLSWCLFAVRVLGNLLMDRKNYVAQCLHCFRFRVRNPNVELLLQGLNQLNVCQRIEIPEKRKLLGEIIRIPDAREIHSKNFRKDLSDPGHGRRCDIVLPEIAFPKLMVVERFSARKNAVQLLLFLPLLPLGKSFEPAHSFALTFRRDGRQPPLMSDS